LFPVAEYLFVKNCLALQFDDGDKVKFMIDQLFDLVFKFDQVRGCDISPKDTFLVVFEILFATFEHFGNSVFAGFALSVGDIVKDKSIVVVVAFPAQHFSLREKGRNGFSSTKNLISL